MNTPNPNPNPNDPDLNDPEPTDPKDPVDPTPDPEPPKPESDPDAINKLVDHRVEERLIPVKEKLDKAYARVRDLEKQLAEKERENGQLKVDLSQNSDQLSSKWAKEKEDLQMENQTLQATIEEMSKIKSIESAIVDIPFEGERAREIAIGEISKEIIKDELTNEFKHKSEISIKDFVKAFVVDPNNSFLLKKQDNKNAPSLPGSMQTDPFAKPENIDGMSNDKWLEFMKRPDADEMVEKLRRSQI